MTADAMTGLATGKKQNRKQEILTPPVVTSFLRALWGEDANGNPVVLDPCAAVGQEFATFCYHGPEHGHVDGLTAVWMDRTYANPPYGDLERWLRKAYGETARGTTPRIVVLAPTRGHRDWWHEVRDTCDVVVELRPLNFIGYPGSFPAPLSLLCWNVSYEMVRHALQESGLRYTKIALPSV